MPAAYTQQNAEYAMRARNEVPAVSDVPIALFLRDVLPPQHLDEPINEWRKPFFETLLPHVKECKTVKEVAETVIPLTFTDLGATVEFKANQTPGIMAPINETLAHGYASCTGLSILVADALRAVGVPARVVGTPEWNRPERGNHNWVEVWTGDGWHFLDAAPVKKVTWDKAWFAPGHDSATAIPGGIHGIYTAVWDKDDADSNYTVTWRDPQYTMPAIDLTSKYLDLAVQSMAFLQATPSISIFFAGIFTAVSLKV